MKASDHATRVPRCSTCSGVESNRTRWAPREFVDLCRTVGAEPLICVNFESDGRQQYMKAKDSVRTADAKEAAAWVAYCNDPGNAEREAHGSAAPLGVRYWQIGNETSYDKNGFDLETAARKTVEFARAMRAADPSDSPHRLGRQRLGGPHGGGGRASTSTISRSTTCSIPTRRERPVLRGELYRRDPDATWAQLMTRVADDRRQDPSRPRQPGRASDSARDDGMSFHRFLDAIAATCSSTWAAGVLVRPHPQQPSAPRRRARRLPPPPISAGPAGRTTR